MCELGVGHYKGWSSKLVFSPQQGWGTKVILGTPWGPPMGELRTWEDMRFLEQYFDKYLVLWSWQWLQHEFFLHEPFSRFHGLFVILLMAGWLDFASIEKIEISKWYFWNILYNTKMDWTALTMIPKLITYFPVNNFSNSHWEIVLLITKIISRFLSYKFLGHWFIVYSGKYGNSSKCPSPLTLTWCDWHIDTLCHGSKFGPPNQISVVAWVKCYCSS